MIFRRAGALDRVGIEEVVFSCLQEYQLKAEPEGMDRDLADIEGIISHPEAISKSVRQPKESWARGACVGKLLTVAS